MALPSSHLLDELATSFLQAAAAVAGCTIAVQRKDYGVDVTLRNVVKSDDGYHESGFPIDVQIKATTTAEFTNEAVVFDLKVANFNKIVRRQSRSAPYYLVLVCFEAERENWCRMTDQDLTVAAKAYWWTAAGSRAENSSSSRIKIPIDQRFTNTAIANMMAEAEARYIP